ncbi:MAG: creatininase family protein [Planctomycetota bacterium]|nr:MAG: creatininase family protein [Planctomycetota bacterium]REJ94321.1 MAG: creatininase family protein [Planctomycetota bacterium]REK20726.1 MAG: creatininase family protein [Planctomycetota bacterium]REK38091.1 MAG: creatininase family protein [Planctomycetota bacterium]
MQLTDMNWPQVAALDKNTPVLIPVAALEQHGGHMPVFTDSMLLGEVVRRVSEKLDERILFAPLMWLGNSDHHMDFPGTLSAPPRVYLDLLNGLAENFLFHGFKRIVFLNGHGGNIVPGRQATFELRQRHRDRTDLLLLFATYWDCGQRPNELRDDFSQQQMGHAGEWETSMILKIAPHLVGDLSKLHTVDFDFSFSPAIRGWTTKDRSETGHIGFPQHASAEKGELLFQTFADGVVDLMTRVADWDGQGWSE